MSGSKLYPHSVGVAIYVRESRDDNEENIETIETQRDILVKYANLNSIGSIYKIYIDDNISGTTFDRPGLKELQNDVIAGHIDILLIKDLSRLGRNNAKTLLFLDFLEENGVKVITSDGRFDSSTDGDLVGIESWFNERYAKDISRKIRSNLKHKISQGEFLGKPPYGYEKSSIKKNTLQINPEQADVVRQIYKMYLDGIGYKKIADILNEQKIPTPSGAKGLLSYTLKWSNVSVQRILTNRVYLGETIQGVSEKVNFKSKKTRRLPVDKWIITSNTHEKIIDDETFLAVENLRTCKKSKFSCTDKGNINTYRGMIFCGLCQNPMYSRKRAGNQKGYICREYTRYGKRACTSHFVNESELNNIIADELRSILMDKEYINNLNKRIRAAFQDSDKEKYGLILMKNLKILKHKQEKIYSDMLDGLITKDLFIRMNNTLEGNIKKLYQDLDINCTTNLKKEEFDASELLEEIINLCDEKRLPYQLVKLFIKKITVFNRGECLQSNLTGENTQMIKSKGIILVEFD